MKTIITILFLNASLNLFATNTVYYISSVGNDASNGTSAATPWKTLTKINSTTFGPGDWLLFRRDDAWYGSLTLLGNGVSGNPITISAYGSGNAPIISGFVLLSGWVSVGTNLWEATCTSSGNNGTATTNTLNMVTRNGMPKHMGRFPNLQPEFEPLPNPSWRKTNGRNAGRGYLDYEAVSGTTFTDNELSNANPTNISYAGGEVQYRAESWNLGKKGIASNSGDIITLTGSITGTRPSKGYFIQNHPNTLDQQDEWYYNAGTSKLRVYSTTNPGTEWRYAQPTDVINAVGRQYWTISDVTIEGGDMRGIRIDGSNTLKILRCTIQNIGGETGLHSGAIATQYQGTCSNLLIDNCVINHCSNMGISIRTMSTNVTVTNTKVLNCGAIPGMGDWLTEGYSGMTIYAQPLVIQYCTVDSTGWSGINPHGQDMNVSFNYIRHFCLVKDDGGGLYSSNTLGSGYRLFQKNIIIDGGNPYGGKDLHWDIPGSVQGQTRGLYVDEVSDNYNIQGNTVARVNGEGYYFHIGKNMLVRDNLSYDAEEFGFVNDNDVGKAGASSGFSVKSNVFATSNRLSKLFFHKDEPDNMGSIYTLDSNYYIAPFQTGSAGMIERVVDAWCSPCAYIETWKSLQALKAQYGSYEVHSWESPVYYKQYSSVTNVGSNLSTSTSLTSNAGTSIINVTGELVTSKIYRLKFTAQRASGGQNSFDGVVTLTSSNSSQTELVDRMYSGNNQGFQVTSTPYNVDWIFRVDRNSGAGLARIEIKQPTGGATTNITNLDLHEVTTTLANVDDSIRLVVNPSKTDSVISVPGIWKDHKGATINNTITLAPYTSELLFKTGSTGNIGPSVNAGIDRSIQLPTNSTSSSGASASDPDGTVTVLWTQTSGPNTAGISAPTNTATNFTGLISGNYVMRLRATDNNGAFADDVMSISVAAANIPPLVNAGLDLTVQLPTSTATLNGSSSDPDGSVASKLWTKLSGPAGGTITSPTANITGITSLIAGSYFYQLSATDNQGAVSKDTVQVTVNPAPPVVPKITALYKQYTYDLRGYEAEGGGNPYGLVNGGYDPKNGISTLGTLADTTNLKTSIHARTKGYAYNSNIYGSQIDFDLKVNYDISEIWFYDWGYNADSVYIMAGTWNSWDTLVKYKTTGVTETWGWKSRTFSPRTTSKIRVTFVNSDLDSNGALGEVSEIVLYGSTASTPPAAPSTIYSGSRQATPSVRDFIWINTWKEIDSLKWWKPFGGVRIYKHRDWFDTAAVNTFPTKMYRENIFSQPTSTQMRYYSQSLKDRGTKMYISYKEAPQYIRTSTGGEGRVFVTDIYGQDPRNKSYYRTDSMFFNHRAKLFGSTVHSLANVYISDVAEFSGINTMTEIQIGNEEMAWSNPVYVDPVMAAAQSIKAYEGIKAADAATKVIMSPFTKPDTNALKVQYYALGMMGNPATQYYDGGIALHQYQFRGQNEFPATAVYDTGATKLYGALPEQFGFLPRARAIREATYRIAGNVPLFLDEFNWNRNQSAPFAVPILPTLDAASSQGCLLVKTLNYGLFAGLDRMAIYWMVNDVGDGGGGIFDAMGLMDAPGPSFQEVPFDSYYWVATFSNILGNFKPSTMDTTGSVWKFKYVHKTLSDSVAYFIATRDTNVTVTNYPLSVGSITGSAKVVTFSDTRDTGLQSTQTAPAGIVTISSIGYIPKMILVKEGTNLSPLVGAGVDRTIQLPTNSITISGASASDPDGTIESRLWTQTSGPNTAGITGPNTLTPDFTGLTSGTYFMRLTVTDNSGTQSYDEMKITVSPANQNPVANAGGGKSVQLPTTTVLLTGSATDADGTVTTYAWTQPSGPGGATIVTPSASTTNVTGLVEGSYIFRLTVTDNQGATDTDEIVVIVAPAGVVPGSASFKVRGKVVIVIDQELEE